MKQAPNFAEAHRNLAKTLAAVGRIDDAEYVEMVAATAPSPGFCNTMGTATTMNSLAETLGMMLPGGATAPAVSADRRRVAEETGRVAVDLAAAKRRETRAKRECINKE